MRFALARQGVFATIQGEGVMMGVPQVFIRLAGCNVGCPECDTDYRPHQTVDTGELARMVVAAAPSAVRWVWVTGGEPMLHRDRLGDLYARLRPLGYKFAVATSGTIPVGELGASKGGPDFVSVSPHRVDSTWKVRRGDQLNAVIGLNGLSLADLEGIPSAELSNFSARFVTPAAGGRRVPTGAELAAWVMAHPGWRLGVQAHRAWEIP